MNRKSKILLIISLVSIFLLVGASIVAAKSKGTLSGGGQLREPNGAKRSQQFKISFGGWVEGVGEPVSVSSNGKQFKNVIGEWQVKLHNVGVDDLDKSKFHATKFTQVTFYPGNSGTCKSAFNFTAKGKLNNKPGYRMIFRGGDDGSPGKNDTARVELWDPNNKKIYDTHWKNEFTDESSCVGTARTGLDKGNLTVVLP